MCVCSLGHPARKAHGPHYVAICVLSVALPFFAPICHKRHDFRRKELLNTKCVLISSTAFVCNISHSKKNSVRCCHKRTCVCMYSTCLYCHKRTCVCTYSTCFYCHKRTCLHVQYLFVLSQTYMSSCTVPVFLVRFGWKLKFIDRFSKKSSNMNFHENFSSGSRVVLCRRIDRQTDRQTDRQRWRS